MDRKTFLKLGAGSTVGLAAWLSACREPNPLDAPDGERALPALGFQLYTMRRIAIRDLDGALGEVAAAGYTEVEFAGYYNNTPEEVRALVRQHGLDPVSTHVNLEALRTDFGGLVDAAHTIGHRYVVLPYLAEEERATADDYRRRAEEFNQFGERFSAEGLTFGYHNHEFEFQPLGEDVGMDILLAETDPALVTFELDLYWVRKGRASGEGYLTGWPGRFRLCHVKDMDMRGEQADVGMGEIDWPRLFRHSETAGLQHFFVEHDVPEDPVASAQRSAAFLRQLRF